MAHLILLDRQWGSIQKMLKTLSKAILSSLGMFYSFLCSGTIQNDLTTFKLRITEDSAKHLEIRLLFNDTGMIWIT